jgi:hypothetical protein
VSSFCTSATCQAELLEHTQPEHSPLYAQPPNNNYVNSNIFQFPLLETPKIQEYPFSLPKHLMAINSQHSGL